MPITLADGELFGTLCAIDSSPSNVNNPMVLRTFKLFAELISDHLDAGESLKAAHVSLERERELAELREHRRSSFADRLSQPLPGFT
ncbi:GAF sensor signal transduction histidine kinase [Rhizobium grahamii CCGE 502]|uniref:GAF sensor signal transduction histidine kinase n=2 Tax=Rhizobium grahamii TaxID=1120045 RepID=S3HEE2_9HYPH|nr:GAF sensor signal transduction histidine kinase [Rhizobium grahamii CCGE 502]